MEWDADFEFDYDPGDNVGQQRVYSEQLKKFIFATACQTTGSMVSLKGNQDKT